MKIKHLWHTTPFGRLACFLGSIRLAVPVMVFVAAALAWGTYLESTAGTKSARATVYGAWWFIALMGLVCVSLIFAVVTRYPWRRKHVGFMVVHASLIALIAGGFWSLFGRVEGQIPLQAGTESGVLTMDQEQLEALRHQAGAMEVADVAEVHPTDSTLRVAGLKVAIVERWPNTQEETFVADDGAAPLRAVELSVSGFGGAWIGETAADAAPTSFGGMKIHLLPAGAEWTPPPAQPAEPTGPHFVLDSKTFPLAEPGSDAVPGWKIDSVRRFERAKVTKDGLIEADQGPENPAIEVVISNGAGTVEQHRAFAAFPDMVMVKPLQGEASSGARLVLKDSDGSSDLLVIHGTPPALKVSFSRGKDVQEFAHDGPLPWSFKAGERTITISSQFTHARAATRMVKAAKAEGNRPALVVRIGDAAETLVLPWQGRIPVQLGDSTTLLRYGPRSVAIPFVIRLDEFRKVDYPGTQTAMAYESDVTVTLADGKQETANIHMNHPYQHAGWKVYQSGFMGTDVSIFSVMRDPGLPLTYAACIGLCVGIVITFYSRAFSQGHPGIPAPFARKESRNGALSRSPGLASPADGAGDGAGALDQADGLDPRAGERTRHAPGHVRDAGRGPAHRPVEVV